MKYTIKDTKIVDAKAEAKGYKISDGGGLYIWVAPTGVKSWRYNYRFSGSYKTLTIGIYPGTSIRQARAAHGVAADQIVAGNDPAEVKQNTKAGRTNRPTFRKVSEQWLAWITPKDPAEQLKQKKSIDRNNLMVRYLNDSFGDVALGDLELEHLADVLIKFDDKGQFENRARAQSTAIRIIGWAIPRSDGTLKRNPFFGVKYADSFKAPPGVPRPAIIEHEPFGYLLRKIEYYEGRHDNHTGIGLKLLGLTAVRPGELVSAEWAHFDLDNAKWVIPAEELKMRTKRKDNNSPRAGKGLEVPLSRQALALLRDLHSQTGHGKYLFPGRQKARTMADTTLNNALKAMGYQGVHCAHGFRSSFSSIMNEQFRDTVDGHQIFIWEKQDTLIEMQLDHDDPSTRAIYARGGRYPHRVELMQHWADLIDRLRSGKTPATKPRLVAVA